MAGFVATDPLVCLGHNFSHAPLVKGDKVVLLRDGDRLDKPIYADIAKEVAALVKRGVVVVEAWPDRHYLDLKGTDFNDIGQREADADEIIRRILLAAVEQHLTEVAPIAFVDGNRPAGSRRVREVRADFRPAHRHHR